MCALGGVSFFNVAADEPAGDMALLEKVMEGANAPVDEAAEERKGGAGDIGKFFLSAGEAQLAAYGHLPKALVPKGLSLKVRGGGCGQLHGAMHQTCRHHHHALAPRHAPPRRSGRRR